MKKIYIALLAIFLLQPVFAQDNQQEPSVEKSLFNIQTGLVGAWVSYEARLSNRWALRTEVGLDLWYYETYQLTKKDEGVLLTPSINIEPRWYYNLNKRADKGKHIENNSANFLTVAFRYYPDLFIIGGPDNLYVPDQISIIPKWGIRRAIAKSNFNYELGIGVGPIFYFKEESVVRSQSDVIVDLHARIGYTF